MSHNLRDSRFVSKSTGNLRQVEKHNYLGPWDSEFQEERNYGLWANMRRGRRVSQYSDSPYLTESMPSSASRTSSTSSRPASIRSRASSAASSGLDSSQVHLLLNKRDSRSSIYTTTSNGEPLSPTSPTSVNSLMRRDSQDEETDFNHRKSGAPEARRMSESQKNEKDKVPPRKTSNIITVKPRVDKSPMNTDRSADAVLMNNENEKNSEPHPTRTIERNLTEPSLTMAATMYLNEIVWQIDDLVFVGGIEASCNINLLCRLNVTFFMDLTDDPDRKDNKTPCLCSKPSRHSRYMVDIKLPQHNEAFWVDVNGERVSMSDMFERFISLTEKAMKAGSKVLVFSNKGRNKAPAFAAAYLMSKHRISRAVAVNRVLAAMESMRPAVNICDYLQRSLMRYQSHKGIQVDQAHDYTHSLPLFRVPKTAWI